MKTTILLFLLATLCFTTAACATPAETTAAITASIGAAGAFIHELAPILSPEMQAKLTAAAGHIDGTVQATQSAVGIIADAIAQFKANVGGQVAQVGADLAQHAKTIAEMPSRTELYATNGGVAAAATGASRLLSHFKHAPKISAA